MHSMARSRSSGITRCMRAHGLIVALRAIDCTTSFLGLAGFIDRGCSSRSIVGRVVGACMLHCVTGCSCGVCAGGAWCVSALPLSHSGHSNDSCSKGDGLNGNNFHKRFLLFSWTEETRASTFRCATESLMFGSVPKNNSLANRAAGEMDFGPPCEEQLTEGQFSLTRTGHIGRASDEPVRARSFFGKDILLRFRIET